MRQVHDIITSNKEFLITWIKLATWPISRLNKLLHIVITFILNIIVFSVIICIYLLSFNFLLCRYMQRTHVLLIWFVNLYPLKLFILIIHIAPEQTDLTVISFLINHWPIIIENIYACQWIQIRTNIKWKYTQPMAIIFSIFNKSIAQHKN